MREHIARTVMMLWLLVVAPVASADQPLRVTTTLSTFAELVRQIGGEQVEVSTIAPPRFNPHFIEPRPSDVLKVKKAALFVHAGLDLETWRGPLLDAAGNPRVFPGQPGELDLSRGLALLEVPNQPLSRLMGDIHLYGNPHYWLDPENVRIMARAIAAKLSALDPASAGDYQARLAQFLTRLDEATPRWREQLAAVRGREALGYHRSWPYLARFAGLTIEQHLEPKPGVPPTPKHLAFLEAHIRARQIPAILQETFAPPGPAQALARRAGIRVVTLCQNVGELPEASDYFAWMDYNVHQLAEAFGGSP